MRTDIPPSLQAHLNSRETTLCWCWKITKTNNEVMGFTNHDRPLTFDGVSYEASTGFLGTEMESQLGMAVDNMDVYGAVDSEVIKEEEIEAGLYDNAVIEVFLVNWADVSQRVIIKKGNLGQVRRGKTMFQTEVRGVSHQLQQLRGRVFQYSCDARLGDSRCGKDVSGSTFTASSAISSTDGNAHLVATSLSTYNSGWFSKGTITFTSGDNLNVTREIKSHFNSNGVVSISLWDPTPFVMEAGDTFTVVAGCDKTFRVCKSKFDNEVSFRGFPHIPGTHTVTEYGVDGENPNFDGGGKFFGKD